MDFELREEEVNENDGDLFGFIAKIDFISELRRVSEKLKKIKKVTWIIHSISLVLILAVISPSCIVS